MLRLAVAMCIALIPANVQAEPLATFRKEFVRVTPGVGKFPGSFVMGCPDGNKQEVKLNKPFFIAKYEATQKLWQTVMGNNPSRWKGPRNSVEMLALQEAQEFCKKATVAMRKAKLISGDELIRLPSEIEWEYTARAGTTTEYSFGDDVSKLGEHAWSSDNAAGNDPAVGAKKPNPWGLYDVHGYLWEWCELTEEKRTTTKSIKTGVVRGGSWKDKAEKLSSCSRIVVNANSKDDAIGLRCVLSKEKNVN